VCSSDLVKPIKPLLRVSALKVDEGSLIARRACSGEDRRTVEM